MHIAQNFVDSGCFRLNSKTFSRILLDCYNTCCMSAKVDNLEVDENGHLLNFQCIVTTFFNDVIN